MSINRRTPPITKRVQKIIHRIHPEGRRFLLAFLILYAGIVGVLAMWEGIPRWLVLTVGLIGGALLILLLFFFRNPRRTIPYGEDLVLAPADGTIVAIERIEETEVLKKEAWKISIFMAPWTPHVNRVPISGTVRYVRYHPGRYVVAWHPKSSELNERNTVAIERVDGEWIVIRQIAGFIARRIKCYLRPGQTVTCGQELGFIKFGSRVDIFLPIYAELLVEVEDHVRAGETVIAQLPLQAERSSGNSAFKPSAIGPQELTSSVHKPAPEPASC